MAILRGFPASNTISPSVRIAEKDMSFYSPEQSFHRAGLVGFASKGPINVPTVIRTKRQLNTVFGFPHPEAGDPYLIYAAEQYLLVANELYVVRVADNDAVSSESAQTAEVAIPSAGGQIIITSDVVGNYSFSKTMYFRWRLNGVLASKTLSVLADSDNEDPDIQMNGYTAAQLAEELNLQLLVTRLDGTTGNDYGVQFFHTDDNRIGIMTTWAFGPASSLEFVSVQDCILGGPLTADPGSLINDNITGLGQAMEVAMITGGNDRWRMDGYQTPGVWDFSGIDAANMTLVVVVDGTDNVTVDNVSQEVDLGTASAGLVGRTDVTTQEIVDAINNIVIDQDVPGSFEAVAVGNNVALRTLHHGRDARLLVKTDSGLFDVLGFNVPAAVTQDYAEGGSQGVVDYYATAKGYSPEGVATDPAVYTFGIITGADAVAGDYTFTIYADSAGIEGNTTQVRFTNNDDGTFNVEVFNSGVSVENWGMLSKDDTSRFYVESFLPLVSDYIRIVDGTTPAPPKPGVLYSLSGGSDGIPSDPDDQDRMLIGNPLAYSGLYALSEPEQIDIDVIAVPGHPSTSVVLAMLDVCQNMRMDCLAIIDPPFGLTASEVVKWQNGTHYLNTVKLDSDFGALYWPWVKISDSYNRIEVWVPPSGSVLAVYARNDQIGEPWFAPAGLNRGIVPGILDVFSRPNLDERDQMYGNYNAVNPIVQFSDSFDYVVWGQKTLQRRPTALDRVNVRRLLFAAEKRIRAASRRLLFEPNDQIFRQKFIDICKAILRDIQVRRGLTDFVIECGSDLNTPEVIDRNEFRARIGLIPVKAVEFIFIEFAIFRTGSDFTETSDTF